jgi:hypothetical protein
LVTGGQRVKANQILLVLASNQLREQRVAAETEVDEKRKMVASLSRQVDPSVAKKLG